MSEERTYFCDQCGRYTTEDQLSVPCDPEFTPGMRGKSCRGIIVSGPKEYKNQTTQREKFTDEQIGKIISDHFFSCVNQNKDARVVQIFEQLKEDKRQGELCALEKQQWINEAVRFKEKCDSLAAKVNRLEETGIENLKFEIEQQKQQLVQLQIGLKNVILESGLIDYDENRVHTKYWTKELNIDPCKMPEKIK